MAIITVRIDDELKKEMDKLSYINWSEVIRQSIIKTIEEEKKKNLKKNKDWNKIKEAGLRADEIFMRLEGGGKSEETIRYWRDRNWQL